MDEELLLGFDEVEPVKRCTMCKRWLPLTDFHRDRSRLDGRQNRCRPCNTDTNKRWYRNHPEARGARLDEYARRRRQRLQALVLRHLRTHPCVDCGESDPVVLDFDHLRDKAANISAMVTSRRPWSAIVEEMAKCEVVCANCHRRRTAQRANSFRWRNREVE